MARRHLCRHSYHRLTAMIAISRGSRPFVYTYSKYIMSTNIYANAVMDSVCRGIGLVKPQLYCQFPIVKCCVGVGRMKVSQTPSCVCCDKTAITGCTVGSKQTKIDFESRNSGPRGRAYSTPRLPSWWRGARCSFQRNLYPA